MYKTILVPIEMAHVAEGKAIIDVAAEHVSDGAKIILLNVVEDIPSWAAAQIPKDVMDRSQQYAEDELKGIANSSGMKLETLVRRGQPYNTILEVAKEKNVDLIIVASHRPGFQDYFLGSTAAKVVRHATCSVLVVR